MGGLLCSICAVRDTVLCKRAAFSSLLSRCCGGSHCVEVQGGLVSLLIQQGNRKGKSGVLVSLISVLVCELAAYMDTGIPATYMDIRDTAM